MKVCPKCTEQNEDWMNICQVCGADISRITVANYEETLKKQKREDPFFIEAKKKTNPFLDLYILIGVLSVILIILIFMVL